MRPIAIVALLLALPAQATDSLAVLALAEPPGPSADLAEMTNLLRAACRDRLAGVLDAPELRARLLGRTSSATLAELDRAFGGVLAANQKGEYEEVIRTLQAIVEDLERMPGSPEAYAQWTRAQLRLAHAEATLRRMPQARAAMERVIAVEPKYQPDPDQYSPTYRREFDAARARVVARPRRSLTVTSVGLAGTVYVDGRPSGTTPMTIALPAGRYRIAGSAGALHLPSVWIDLRDEDRSVVLDFALAEAFRERGPGLALGAPARAPGLIRAGAWLGVDRVVAASVVADGDARYLVGSLYDVRRGALTREGRVRLASGAVPPPSVTALAAFLISGQQSAVVESSTPAPRPLSAPAPDLDGAAEAAGSPAAPAAPAPAAASVPPARLGIRARPWMRPVAYAAGAGALLLAGYATYQGVSASGSYREARSMVRSDGTLLPGADAGQYSAKLEAGDSASRRAYVAAGGTLLMAALAGVLWYVTGEPQSPAAVRF